MPTKPTTTTLGSEPPEIPRQGGLSPTVTWGDPPRDKPPERNSSSRRQRPGPSRAWERLQTRRLKAGCDSAPLWGEVLCPQPKWSGQLRTLGLLCGGGNGNPLQYSLPGKSHGQRSLADYSPWSRKRLGRDLAIKQQLDLVRTNSAFMGKRGGLACCGPRG